MASAFGIYGAAPQRPAGDDEDDLYGGFNQDSHQYASAFGGYGGQGPEISADAFAQFAQQPMMGGGYGGAGGMAPIGTAAGRRNGPVSFGAVPGTAAAGGGAGDGPRPMTSVRAAGYTSAGNRPAGFGAGAARPMFDPLQQASNRGPLPALQKKTSTTPEEIALDMEKKVNELLEEAAMLNQKKDFVGALERAKEAGKKERLLCKHREQNGLGDQINFDLTYSVAFNLAVQYHACGMYNEALNTYSLIVKNKQYVHSGRLRVNMGNIYFEQKKYPQAIKMYRMALDQIPSTGKEVRFKIMKNIGNSFVRLGQYPDAVASFEAIMDGAPDPTIGFNLLLCYFAQGDRDKMKRGFTKLLNCKVFEREASEDEDNNAGSGSGNSGANGAAVNPDGSSNHAGAADEEDPLAISANDPLFKELRERRKQAFAIVVKAARLIAPVIERDWQAGFDYSIEQLKAFELRFPEAHLSSELEMCKALEFLRHKKISKAIESLKSFEKKDPALRARAATNLSYLYFLEEDYANSERFSEVAVQHDKYSAKALVNLGNCFFVKQAYEEARHQYAEALSSEADCVEAIYNLGLAFKQLHMVDDALRTFRKLHSIVPDWVETVYQIANLYDMAGEYRQAIDWFNRLISRVPTDPTLLARLGSIYAKEGDESQAFHYHLESYRYFPVNMDVISWLGAYFVKNEVYEKAMTFFERASQIQPQEIKWQLMVASCHRRIGAYQQAKRLYENIHTKSPDNIECLRYLVHICNDLGLKEEVLKYHGLLKRLEAQQQEAAAASPAMSAAPAASRSARSVRNGGGNNDGYDEQGEDGGAVSGGGGGSRSRGGSAGVRIGSASASRGGYDQEESMSSSPKMPNGGMRGQQQQQQQAVRGGPAAAGKGGKAAAKGKNMDETVDDWGDELPDDLLPM